MLQSETIGPVLRLTLNRPEVRNAFDEELLHALTEAFTHLDPSIRAVVLSGAGSAFCAGGDLEWMRKTARYTDEENIRDATKIARLFRSMVESRALVIVKTHGACFGGGCGLVAAADIAIADEGTQFAFSEVRLGLIPATISPYVIDKIGRGQARGLFATGETFDAAHALRIGLVQEIGNAEAVEAAIERRLKAVLLAGPESVRMAKRLVLDGELTLDECAKRLARVRAGREAREGITAFLDKRKASFAVEWPLES